MPSTGEKYQRNSDSTVHELIKIFEHTTPPSGLLLGGGTGAWTVTEVTAAVLTAQYSLFQEPIVVDDHWVDLKDANNVYRIASVFTADGTTWVALDPLDSASVQLVTEGQLRTRGRKV